MMKYTFEITWNLLEDDGTSIVLIVIRDTDYFRAWNNALRKAEVLTSDYEELKSIECVSMINERL